MKRIFSYLLAVLLCCCLFLTGCSHKEETMFSTLKEINQISSYEVHTQADINMETDGESTPISLTVDGSAGNQNLKADIIVNFGAFSITLEDFIRMTDGTLYVNLSSLASIPGISDYLEMTTDWISFPVNTQNEKALKEYQDFYNAFIDALEIACKDQTITQENDTWKLELSGKQIVSFAQAALEQVNTNFSDWYDLYVAILEKSGSDDLLKEYAALSGEEAEDDPIQALKDGKEEALNSWKEMYPSLQESLTELEESISKGEMKASAAYEISLTGKTESRKATQKLIFDLTEAASSDFIHLSIEQTMTEAKEPEVEAPKKEEVTTFEDLMKSYEELQNSYYEEFDDDSLFYDLEDDIYMSDEEYNTIASSLEKNQIYLFNSEWENKTPYVLTYDTDTFSTDEPIGDFSVDLNLKGTESYVNIAYDSGTLTDDLKTYYLTDGQTLKELSTDIGTILYATDKDDDGWGYIYTVFGMQLDDDSYLIGLLDLEESNKVDAETYLKKLLLELTPYSNTI